MSDHLTPLERVRMEMALFPEMNPGPVIRTTPEGVILLVNASARAVFGDEELPGRTWSAVCPGFQRDVWDRVVAGEDRLQHESDVGERVLTFTYRRPHEVDSIFIYGNDITERKKAEQLLSRQSAHIAEIARFPEMNPGPVLRADTKGSIILANAAARDVFGSDTLIGASWKDLCPGMDGAIWNKILAASEVVRFEARLGHRVFSFAHRRTPEGHLVFIFGTDITALRQAEETLRQSEKMAMLGTLAAGVAHELNNPAAAATSSASQLRQALAGLQEGLLPMTRVNLSGERAQKFLDLAAEDHQERALTAAALSPLARCDLEGLLEEWLDNSGAAKAWELAPTLVSLGYSETELSSLSAAWGDDAPAVIAWIAGAQLALGLARDIEEATRRISTIVGALKTYSFLDQGDVLVVDVRKGLDSTLLMLNSKLKNGIAVIREYDPDPPEIEAFGSELNQVWTNLIDNAVDAMGGVGQIIARVRRDGDGVVVEIEDNGPGMPPNVSDRVFDPFFTTKEPGKGAGLGLSTAKNIIVKKHGGRIEVTSRPGRTCFTVWLPVRIGTGEGRPAAAAASNQVD